MELIQCHVDNFGGLSNRTFHFSKGLNAFCMENGQGKSTLCDFIKCMLYGLSESRRQDLAENERKHYLPWQGGLFGGSLTLSYKGTVYRIVRRFGLRPSEDRCEVYHEKTGEMTNALGNCPGETIFRLDAQGFSSCARFSERGFLSVIENESILSRLGGNEDKNAGSLATAQARLEEERRLYEKKGGHGLIFETEAEIASLMQKQAVCLQKSEDLSKRESELIEAKAALSALTGKSAEASLAQKTSSAKKITIRTLPMVLSLLVSFAALLSGVLLHPLFFAALTVAALLFPLSFSKRNAAQRKTDEKETTATPLFEERYRACAACERAYTEALEAAEEAAYLAVEIEQLHKKKQQYILALSDIKRAEELLAIAARRYRESRSDSTHVLFQNHLAALGEDQSKNFRLSDRFVPVFLNGQNYRSGDVLSQGEKDRVSLARSLALLSAMPEDCKPPLLLDDPFLAYDDGHISLALKAVEELAAHYQILYLTCSHSRMP